jgi:hypothetical protein
LIGLTDQDRYLSPAVLDRITRLLDMVDAR